MTKIAETTDTDVELREVIAKVAKEPFASASFAEISRAAFQDDRSRFDLDVLVGEWDSWAPTLGIGKSETRVLHGYLQFLRGELADAETILKSEKSQPWGAYFCARALLAEGKVEEAASFLASLKASGDAPPVVYVKSEVLCRSGKEAEAAELLEKLGDEERGKVEWQLARAFCHEKSGRYDDAIQAYRRASVLDADCSEAWFRLGYLLDLHGDGSDAEEEEVVRAYEQCVRIPPVHVNALMNLGLIYEDRERYHDAIKCYETILKSYPNHDRARLYLGDAIAATRMFYDRDQEKKADRHSQILRIPVTDFELSVRSRNCLQKMNIETLGDLIMKTEQELLSYKNFGETSLKEIKDMLSQKGLRLGQGLEDKGKEPPSGRNPLEATAPVEVLEKPIEELNLSVRSRRCMERLEVRSVRELINKSEVELMSAKNFGMTSLNEIKKKLAEMGLALRS